MIETKNKGKQEKLISRPNLWHFQMSNNKDINTMTLEIRQLKNVSNSCLKKVESKKKKKLWRKVLLITS